MLCVDIQKQKIIQENQVFVNWSAVRIVSNTAFIVVGAKLCTIAILVMTVKNSSEHALHDIKLRNYAIRANVVSAIGESWTKNTR